MRIIDFFDQGATLYPQHLAFVETDTNTHYTYSDAAKETHKIASAIRGRGYCKGSKIAILAPNCNFAFVTLLGLFRAEAIWLPINPRNALEINIDLLNRFDAELLIYHSCYESEAIMSKERVSGVREIVCLDSPHCRGEELKNWCKEYQEDFKIGPEDPEDIVALFPTGGTTGKSKGVLISHKNLQTLFANFWAHFKYYDHSRHLVVAPMTHSAGVLGMAHFARGGTNYMMATPNTTAILAAIGQYQITHVFVPPTILYMMLVTPHVRNYNYSSIQHILIGSAPTSLEKLKEAIDIFGPVMTEAFGQTESPAAITAKAPWDYINDDGSINETRLKSIGRPCVFNRVVILNDNGVEVAHGESGEICIKGDLVTPGYYQNPEATAEIRKFGWHHTGDIGVMSDDGYITIVDRIKDMIITGGFNVFPNEVEQILTQHPSVQDCAVIGIPDKKWGEAIKGVIQLKVDKKATEQELIAMVKKNLGSVMAPKTVDFVTNLPRSSVGKVLKTELRKQY